ncbi:MAG: RNA methyltransferase [Myxococcales bacterium]|nr:RNA methyltransferase [Myxococcales bacterium]
MTAVLPQRYQNTDWLPPNRQEEEAVLAMAPPELILQALGQVLTDERRARLDAVAAARLSGVVVVLENLRDPHNGGAVLRSCEAVGIHEVHIIESVETFRTSAKITQGCDKWLDIVAQPDTSTCLQTLRRRGFRLCAAVPGAQKRLEDLDPHGPVAFLLGNEHAGLSQQARSECDAEFAIPLAGFSESLNLSVATAITVYTHCRRRREALGREGDLSEQALLQLRARYYARDVRGGRALVEHYRRRLAQAAASAVVTADV